MKLFVMLKKYQIKLKIVGIKLKRKLIKKDINKNPSEKIITSAVVQKHR
jgi:hypothetical protein